MSADSEVMTPAISLVQGRGRTRSAKRGVESTQRPEKWDDRKLLISGYKIRRAEAWPDIDEAGDAKVAIESSQRMRDENRANIEIGDFAAPELEVNGADLAQIAACMVRAVALAVADCVIGPLSPESTELLRRLEAAVAMGDESNA